MTDFCVNIQLNFVIHIRRKNKHRTEIQSGWIACNTHWMSHESAYLKTETVIIRNSFRKADLGLHDSIGGYPTTEKIFC